MRFDIKQMTRYYKKTVYSQVNEISQLFTAVL